MIKLKTKSKIENKVKKTNNITPIVEDTKVKKSWTESYFNLNQNKLMPIAPETVECLFYDFHQDALKNPETIFNSTFFREKGVPISSVHRWKDLTDKTKFYWQEANEAIGDRRERGAYNKEKDVSIVIRSAAFYKQQWKDIDKYQADLKKESEHQGNQVVIIEKFPDSYENK